MRSRLIVANWKMHFSVTRAVTFAGKLAAKPIPEGVTVCLAPHNLALSEIAMMVQKTGLKLAAQNAYFQDEGAYTGEISMPMLRGMVQYVLIGHSERRHIFHESHELIKHKVAAAVRSGIKPVLCIGETLVERQHFHTKQVITDQLLSGLSDLTSEEIAKVVIAYEPVWALSSGKDFSKHKAATPDDIMRAQAIIRSNIAELYGYDVAAKIKVLYGGSTNSDNAAAFLNTEGTDGLLVGGASLSVASFWPIVEIAGQVAEPRVAVKK